MNLQNNNKKTPQFSNEAFIVFVCFLRQFLWVALVVLGTQDLKAEQAGLKLTYLPASASASCKCWD